MRKPKLSIFLHHPYCSLQCGAGMYEALSPHFKTTFFTVNDIKESTFKDVDIISFPGGIGDSDIFDKILKPHKELFQSLLYQGKKYLGICMGAYWAGKHYFNILEGVDTVQYIKRPHAEIKRSFSTTTNVYWEDEEYEMFFYDGCAMIGNQNKFETIAYYQNGDPMAIIQDNIGIIGCHPESMPSWYPKKYLKEKWHYWYHHKLLADFTQRLL
jgi:glutamine amidotransferase-like uncharacterized protein